MVDDLGPGLFELLITEELSAQLERLPAQLRANRRRLEPADASDRLAWHVGQQIERSLLDFIDEDRVAVGVKVARALLERLGSWSSRMVGLNLSILRRSFMQF